MNRDEMLGRLRTRTEPWDILIIGGGATGVGIAVDAASRGYEVALVEGSDFGKGTSSRSTKLVHGGVRYLERGDISLVMEALKERGLLRRNAPHLVHDLAFVVPTYDWWEGPFYGVGMRVYDLLAGKYGFGPSRNLSREETLARLPTLKTEGLRGGVVYFDGQFDDSRLLIHLARTAAEQGATLVNYCPATGIVRGEDGMVAGATVRDGETGEELTVRARAVVNATGPFADAVRRMSDPAAPRTIAPSQGVHLTLDKSFLPGDTAIMVPHTRDGRVMFAIPWNGSVIVGTTDTPIAEATLEPVPTDAEIDFILETAGGYLERPPTRADVRSVFAGIRPLVNQGDGGGGAGGGGGKPSTAKLSREHTIDIDAAGLITITGGKWTTYRRMAEECVDQAATIARLDERPCITRTLNIHGFHSAAEKFGPLAHHGTDAPAILDLIEHDPSLGTRLHPALASVGAEVVWAARFEMARTVDDILARRTRALFLDAPAAMAAAPRVADLLAQELGRDRAWAADQIRKFGEIASGYLLR